MSGKIAPRLQEVVRLWPPLPGHRRDPGDQGDELRREMRALLAVARAAKRVAHSEWCEVWSGEPCNCPSKDVARALSRLSRAGEGE